MHAVEACDRSPAYTVTTIRSVWDNFVAAEFGATFESQLSLVFDGIDEADMDKFEEFAKVLSESAEKSPRIRILLVGRLEMESVIRNDIVGLSGGTVEVSSQVNSSDIMRVSAARYNEYIKIQKIQIPKGESHHHDCREGKRNVSLGGSRIQRTQRETEPAATARSFRISPRRPHWTI